MQGAVAVTSTADSKKSEILVVGSLAYDSITTPVGRRERTLGGSANYFSLAASLSAKVNVVGVVGEDYLDDDLRLLKDRGVRTDGLQKVAGDTFFGKVSTRVR